MTDPDAWLDDVRRWYFGGTAPATYLADDEADALAQPTPPLTQSHSQCRNSSTKAVSSAAPVKPLPVRKASS